MTHNRSTGVLAPRDPNHSVQTARGQMRFFTIIEVAEFVAVSVRTVRRWIRAGDLLVHRIGGVVRIAEGDLRAFLAAHRGDAP